MSRNDQSSKDNVKCNSAKHFDNLHACTSSYYKVLFVYKVEIPDHSRCPVKKENEIGKQYPKKKGEIITLLRIEKVSQMPYFISKVSINSKFRRGVVIKMYRSLVK